MPRLLMDANAIPVVRTVGTTETPPWKCNVYRAQLADPYSRCLMMDQDIA